MKKLLELGNQYAKESGWKDFALLKFCLCAMGIMIGIQVPRKYKKMVIPVSAGVFLATGIPLIKKLFYIIQRDNQKPQSHAAE